MWGNAGKRLSEGTVRSTTESGPIENSDRYTMESKTYHNSRAGISIVQLSFVPPEHLAEGGKGFI